MATNFDFEFYKGTDLAVDLSVVDEGAEADLSGYNIYASLRCRCMKEVVTTLSTENNKITIDKASVRIFFDHETTKQIPVGNYDYDVVFVSPDGFRSNILTGVATCKELITDVDN